MITDEISGVRRQYEAIVLPQRQRWVDHVSLVLQALDPSFEPNLAGVPFGRRAALLSHTLFAAMRAQATGDSELAAAGLSTWTALAAGSMGTEVAYGERRWLVLDHAHCLNRPEIDGLFDTACYLVTPEALRAGFHSLDANYWHETWKLLDVTGLLWLVDIATEIVIHLRYREMWDSLTGYSLLPLVGTVCTDWTDSPIRHAESIVHEASHSLLNMFIEATGTEPLSNQQFWSPWRDTMRPAMGIVHGAWAFSIVHTFYDRLANGDGFGRLSDKQVQYCRERRDYEFARLDVVRPYIDQALDVLGSPLIAQMLHQWYPAAAHARHRTVV